MLRSASPSQDDINSWKSHSQTTQKSFTELCTLNCYGMQGFHSFHGNTAGMYVKYQLTLYADSLRNEPNTSSGRESELEQAKGSLCVCGGF